MSQPRIITTTDEVIIDIYGELGAALSQALPSDDRIIMGHVRDAHAKLRALLDASSAHNVIAARNVVAIAQDETAELILALTRAVVADHLTDSMHDALTDRAVLWLQAHAPKLIFRRDRRRPQPGNTGGR
jgi:tRNA G37 N-methylase Trm5